MIPIRNRTNGFISVIQRPQASRSILAELEELFKVIAIRGKTETIAKNALSFTIGCQVAPATVNEPVKNTKDFLSSHFLLGRSGGEPNVGQLNNNLYCAIDGKLTNKAAIHKSYGIDLRMTDVNVLLKLYSVIKMANPNDYIECIRQFGTLVLDSPISVVLQDFVNNTMIVFTNKPLFTFSLANSYIIHTSEVPNTMESKYAQLHLNKAYLYDISNGYLRDTVALKLNKYRNNLLLKNVGIYFDGTVESAVSIYVAHKILHAKHIFVGYGHSSIYTDTFLEKVCSTLNNVEVRGFYPNYESFMLQMNVDTFIDSLNVDSLDRDFSNHYTYKSYTDIMTQGNGKYIPVFKYMTLPEIVQLGQILEVPYSSLVSCSEPILDSKGFSNCGDCPMCKRDNIAFGEAGVENPFTYIKNVEYKNFTPKVLDDVYQQLRVKILSTIVL